jgi:hypothetical protein
VLIPAVVAIALVGCGIGALVPNAPAPFPGGRTADGWVASSEVGRGFFNSGTCGFSFGSVEIVKYVVQGTTYRLVDPLHCYPIGYRVVVSYLTSDPAAGRVLVEPSRRGAYVALSLAACVVGLGVWLELRDEAVRRRRRRLLHHYTTGRLPFG